MTRNPKSDFETDEFERVAEFILGMTLAAIELDGTCLDLVYGPSSERRKRTPEEQNILARKVINGLRSKQRSVLKPSSPSPN